MAQVITTRHKLVTEIMEDGERKRKINQVRIDEIRNNWRELREKGFAYAKEGASPVILDYEKGRYLYNVLPDGEWKGQRCFIIGGGESLRDFDFSKLKNELVIGVNRAYEKIDCTINFGMDNSLYEWITQGKLGKEAKEKFADFKGFPVWLDSAGYDYPHGIFILNTSGGHELGTAMKDGIAGGTNAGFGALSLAVALGASPIYLLGFDMKGKDGKQRWWHDGYPDKQGERVYKSFINDFQRAAKSLVQKGIQVINLNPDSDLKCFNFGKIEEIKPIDRPIFASYYTKGTGYEDQIKQLKATLRRFNLDNDIRGVDDMGDWYKNTYYKSQFVVETMKRHPDRAIVFVDADAKIRRSPVLFNDYEYDFAFHLYNKKELLGGTLYFKNNKGGRYMADKWLEIDRERLTTLMPQKNLHAVFERCKDKINWKTFGIEYCMIFDCRSRHKVSPVIEHFQLSRKYKDPDQKRSDFKLKSSLTKIKKFCKGKNICVLGNADHMLHRKRDIDSFDIVCRMNRGKPQGKEQFLGKRTDILFLSTGLSRKSMELAYGLPLTVWMTVCHRLAHPWVLRNGIQNPLEDWYELKDKLTTKPSTGLMAINFILKHIDFKKLTIFGFDFFTTKSWYNTKPDSGLKHRGEEEKVLFMKMIKGKTNVRLVR